MKWCNKQYSAIALHFHSENNYKREYFFLCFSLAGRGNYNTLGNIAKLFINECLIDKSVILNV